MPYALGWRWAAEVTGSGTETPGGSPLIALLLRTIPLWMGAAYEYASYFPNSAPFSS